MPMHQVHAFSSVPGRSTYSTSVSLHHAFIFCKLLFMERKQLHDVSARFSCRFVRLAQGKAGSQNLTSNFHLSETKKGVFLSQVFLKNCQFELIPLGIGMNFKKERKINEIDEEEG